MCNVTGLVRLAGALGATLMLVAASGCGVAEVKEQAEAVASAGRVFGVVTTSERGRGAIEVPIALPASSAPLVVERADVGQVPRPSTSRRAARALKLFVTVNSPMGGMASAVTGVEHAPIVVPSWQDVAAGSEFVRRVAADGCTASGARTSARSATRSS